MTLNYGKRAEWLDPKYAEEHRKAAEEKEGKKSDLGEESWGDLWRWYKQYVKEIALPATIAVVVLGLLVEHCEG